MKGNPEKELSTRGDSKSIGMWMGFGVAIGAAIGFARKRKQGKYGTATEYETKTDP
jgi:hypothetical protein